MKIAILLFGQPRFLNSKVNFLKEEFTVPGIQFDYFIHFWEDLGYTPEDDINTKYNTDVELLNKIQLLNPIDYQITNYDILDTATENIINTLNIIQDKNCNYKLITKHRYSFGQHISLKQSYKLMQNYEKKHNFQYDGAIKVRTDFIYKNKYCYKAEELYIKDKIEQYNLIIGEKNYIKSGNPCHQQYNPQENKWNIIEKYNKVVPENLPFVRDKYNILRVGDVGTIADRIAANYYFNKWIDTYIYTFIHDIRMNYNNHELLIHRRHDGLQGEIGILNNTTIYDLNKPRNKRIVLANNHRKKWIKKNFTIIVDSNNNQEEEIQKQLSFFYKDK